MKKNTLLNKFTIKNIMLNLFQHSKDVHICAPETSSGRHNFCFPNSKLILFIVLVASIFSPVFAEKIPVRIAPTQVVSTNHDEIEVGDRIHFEVVNDVYKDDDLYIKKGTNLIGIVDFIHPNGWFADSADIKLLNFVTTNVNGQKININYPVRINGNKLLENDAKHITIKLLTPLNYFSQWCILSPFAIFFRGSEIYLEPDSKTFNLFIEQ